jgi:hypothetical protein
VGTESSVVDDVANPKSGVNAPPGTVVLVPPGGVHDKFTLALPVVS